MARTSIHALLFVLVGSYQWQVSTLPELTPSTILSACPDDEVVINCHESDTTMEISLRWEITPTNNLFNMIELALTDMMNDTERQDFGLKFHAEWISHTPLRAILTTTADQILDGATVTCASSGSAISNPLTIRVTQLDQLQPEIQWLNVTGGQYEADNLTVIIEWEGNNDCLNFTISLTPPIDASLDNNITTRNRSHSFNIFYNTNYTVTVAVADSSGNNSDEISKTFNFIKCEAPAHRENLVISGYNISPALENAQISVSCLPGYSFMDTRETAKIMSRCTSEGAWEPDLDLKCHGQPKECSTCTAATGYLIRTVALGVGIPLTFACLCLVGATAAVLVAKRKKGSSKQENKQSAEDSQNRENHTIEHWGIYSLLTQPDQAGSTRNSAVYAEIGLKAIIPPEARNSKGARPVVMPDTNVQYAAVKKKPQSTAEQQEHYATGLDMNIVLHLDQLLLKLRSQVSPKWRQFGFAVRVPVETLNDLSSYQEEQRFSEIAGYWMKQHQGRLTWREVARIMKEIDLNDLAEEILSNSTGDAEENETTRHYHTVAELSSTDLSDEPAKTDTDDSNATATVIQDT